MIKLVSGSIILILVILEIFLGANLQNVHKSNVDLWESYRKALDHNMSNNFLMQIYSACVGRISNSYNSGECPVLNISNEVPGL